MILTVNTLFRNVGEASDGSSSDIFRILYINGTDDSAFVIEIYSKKALPIFYRRSVILEDLELSRAEIIKDDPWLKIIKEADLPEKHKILRNKAWNTIGDLVSAVNEPSIFDQKKRGELIQNLHKKSGVARCQIYKYIRKFWQRGKVENALLPDYENSGAKGKERLAGQAKRGRKRKRNDDSEIGEGINIDENIQKVFRLAVSRFYRDSKEITLQDAFDLMLAEYFFEDVHYDENKIKNKILIPPERKPTYAQFYYWYNKEKDIEKDITARKGKNAYALTARPLLSNSTSQVPGPGYRFEIDATVADIYLLSRYNSDWIIGRPVVYVIIDVFSRLIAGLYIGLEGPSWIGAMMALANCVADKVKFCSEYGISISEKDWACHYLPFTLLGDGGEVAGKDIETLAANLRVRVETAAVERGDLKGIVERNFRTIQDKVKPFLPGQVPKESYKRKGIRYILDAKLNIHQFTKIIIDGVLRHNRKYLKTYTRDEMMIAANVPPIPNQLWEWGITNRTGYLNPFSEEIVKLNLLPEDSGRISRSGIIFKKMNYSCERALREGWFIKGNSRESEQVRVTYDPRKANYVYLKSQNGRSYEKCFLLPTEEKYMNKTLDEIDYLHEFELWKKQRNLPQEQQEFADHAAFVKSVVAKAEQDAEEFSDLNISDAARISQIKKNRNFEKEKRREKEAFEFGKKEDPPAPAKVIPINSNIQVQKPENLDYPDELDVLSRIRKRRKEGQNDD